jgi:hypothetical protein
MHLNHITLNTGHLARTSRADVAPEVTQLLADWLPGTINSGRTHALPVPSLSHFAVQVFVQDGGLVVTVVAPMGPHQQGQPHAGQTMPLITMGVAQRSRQGAPLWSMLISAFGSVAGLQQPGTPWCAVAVHPSIAAYDGPVDWLGDFERCVAWAWLTPNPDLRPA